jgi:radical S-adenosyl methionine domain-containing protein 2
MESQKKNKGYKEKETKTLTSVNWHCYKACNYSCNFCYARFTDLKATPVMVENEGRQLLEQLAEAGVEKINFVGGEPMLHPHLEAWIIHAKDLKMVTSIVSNGTGINKEFLERMTGYLDWIGLSIDASNDALHAELGRGLRGEIARGTSAHLKRMLDVAKLLHEFSIGVKMNTVVTSLNQDDNMSTVVRVIRPHRWKIFQALAIEGENEADIAILAVGDDAFHDYVKRHQSEMRDISDMSIIGEDNSVMLGTYAMIDPLGRVYTNVDGRYSYSTHSALVMGFREAWDEVSSGFHEERFHARDGNWDWNREQTGGEV